MSIDLLEIIFNNSCFIEFIVKALKKGHFNIEKSIQEIIYSEIIGQGLEGWVCEVNKHLIPNGDGYKVDFGNVVNNKLKQMVELKVFKNYSTKDGHEYPYFTNLNETVQSDWDCFRHLTNGIIVTDSDEGQLFYDLIKMLCFRQKHSKEVGMCSVVVVDLGLDSDANDIKELFKNLFMKYINLNNSNKYEVYHWQCIHHPKNNGLCNRIRSDLWCHNNCYLTDPLMCSKIYVKLSSSILIKTIIPFEIADKIQVLLIEYE